MRLWGAGAARRVHRNDLLQNRALRDRTPELRSCQSDFAETTATDHNLYIVGDIMYQSNYDAGFRVIDISEPERPVEIGYFDTSPYQGGASWSNYPFFESGIIAVTGTGDGLFILKDVSRRLIS